VDVSINDLATERATFDAWVVTAPLDQFVGRPGEVAWRGIEMESSFMPTDDPRGTVTAAYVVNHPDVRYPFTRTIESKHATGQVVPGTVVSREFPGAPHRHYPVPTIYREYERLNELLKLEIRAATSVPVHFCGRLANYQYIDQDQAIRQGLDCAERVLGLSAGEDYHDGHRA
jgi:UDP-galactopyranose mutase